MSDVSATQPVLDYTSRDFDAIRAMLVGIASGVMPDWVTVGEAGDMGTLLIELYSYMGDVLNYYIDRVGSEAFLGTAQRRQSVLYMADMLGYSPIGQQAASVILSATLDGSSTISLDLTQGTRVSTADGTTAFELDYDLSLNPGDTNKIVSATEGTSTQVTVGTSKGIPNAEFILPDKGVIFQTTAIQTREGGQVVNWTPIQNTVLARPTQSAFSTFVDDLGFTHVLFGDNSAGRIPPTGATIVASYRFGVGGSANSIASGAINTLVGASSPTGFSITNFDVPLGGSDQETVDAMRFSVPRATAIQDRAVTLGDYVSLSVQVAGIAKAVAYGQVYSSVTVRIAPVGGDSLTSSDLDTIDLRMIPYRNAVASYLSDKVLLGSNVFVEDVYQHNNQGWENINVNLDVFVLPGFNRTQTADAVEAAIVALLAYNTVDFGQRITIGDFYRAAETVIGVDYVNLLLIQGTTATGQVSNVDTPPTSIPRITPEVLDTDGITVITPYGLSINSFGGLVNT